MIGSLGVAEASDLMGSLHGGSVTCSGVIWAMFPRNGAIAGHIDYRTERLQESRLSIQSTPSH